MKKIAYVKILFYMIAVWESKKNVCLFEFQDLYISELEDGNRSKAMNRLRVPPLAEELRVSFILTRLVSTHNVMYSKGIVSI